MVVCGFGYPGQSPFWDLTFWDRSGVHNNSPRLQHRLSALSGGSVNTQTRWGWWGIQSGVKPVGSRAREMAQLPCDRRSYIGFRLARTREAQND